MIYISIGVGFSSSLDIVKGIMVPNSPPKMCPLLRHEKQPRNISIKTRGEERLTKKRGVGDAKKMRRIKENPMNEGTPVFEAKYK